MLAFFNDLSLRNKLLLIMMALTFFLLLALFLIDSSQERSLLKKAQESTTDLATAIQLSVEQLTTFGDLDEGRLRQYIQQKKSSRVQEISLLSAEKELLATSGPKNDKQPRQRKGLLITASLGDARHESLKAYDFLMPIVVQDEKIGYVRLLLHLDDFHQLYKNNFFNQMAMALMVFFLGTLASLVISWRYSQPIQSLMQAACKVASGDLTHASPLKQRDEVGQLTRIFNEMVDNLKTKLELEKKLYQMEYLSTLGQLAAGIAHEVRNPLNTLNLTVDHIRKRFMPAASQDQQEFSGLIVNIKAEVQRLNEMVTNFLLYGKPLKLNLEKVSLEPLIEEAIDRFQAEATEKRVEITFKDDGRSIPVRLDPKQIAVCLNNILLNALQATPEGGRIDLHLLHDPEKGHLEVQVTDNGCGIEEEGLGKVFEPYFTTKKHGIGLGLALTQKIIEEHVGKISLSSQPQQGTQVVIQLPLREEVL